MDVKSRMRARIAGPGAAGDAMRLALVVAAATLARVLTLWVGRPEFTGWFNHTHYYFVQVRGLLERGSLPYADLPLLFHLDALVAALLMRLGLDPDPAVVAATRLVMSLVPALIPLPVYWTIREIEGRAALRGSQWILVLLSGFLPLTLSHVPELLRKNALGLLLLAGLIGGSLRLLRRPRLPEFGLVGLFVLALVLTHFGSAGAALLYGAALLLADAIVRRAPRRIGLAALLVATGGFLALAVIQRSDPARIGRILELARGSLGGSSVAAVLAAGGDRARALAALGYLLAFVALLLLALRSWSRRGAALPATERTFWLAQVLFCALLALPLWDQLLMARWILFASLPLLFVGILLERSLGDSSRIRGPALALLAMLVGLLAVGELVSARAHDAGHEEILADLRRLARQRPFGADDLVLSTAGAEHVVNWFFRVRAGVVTSLSIADFERYDRIWVLDPIRGGPGLEGIEGLGAERAPDRYRLMRRNIPRPPGVEPLLSTATLELFRLEAPPPEWRFAADGRFLGYSRPDPGGASADPSAASQPAP